MKFRTDFVTNSSSSSFVVYLDVKFKNKDILRKKWTREEGYFGPESFMEFELIEDDGVKYSNGYSVNSDSNITMPHFYTDLVEETDINKYKDKLIKIDELQREMTPGQRTKYKNEILKIEKQYEHLINKNLLNWDDLDECECTYYYIQEMDPYAQIFSFDSDIDKIIYEKDKTKDKKFKELRKFPELSLYTDNAIRNILKLEDDYHFDIIIRVKMRRNEIDVEVENENVKELEF